MTPYTFTVPAVTPSLNEWTRMHWGKQGRIRDSFQEMVWALLHEKGNVCPHFERVELNACMMFLLTRRRDSDNYGAVLWKIVQDALVQDGVIPDDTADRCTSHPPRLLVGDREQTVIIVRGWE